MRNYVSKIMEHKTHHEYYLTDMVTFAQQAGSSALPLLAADPQECNGINTPEQLAALRVHLKSGLFFRGAGGLPIGNQIRSVCD